MLYTVQMFLVQEASENRVYWNYYTGQIEKTCDWFIYNQRSGVKGIRNDSEISTQETSECLLYLEGKEASMPVGDELILNYKKEKSLHVLHCFDLWLQKKYSLG